MKVTEPLQVGGVTIEEVDLPSLSDEEIERLNAFDNVLGAESHPEDPPEHIELTAATVRNIPDFMAVRSFWARDPEGSIAAIANARWTRTEDNKHLVRAGLRVRPDRRRRGIAKSLLRLLADVTEAEGRTLLMAVTTDRVAAGAAFARRMGAENAFAAHTNRLLLSDVDRGLVDRWIADGPKRAPGYSLVAIDGRYPDELVAEIVDVEMVMNTAPRDNLDMEDEQWTVEQAREQERTLFAMDAERWSLFARHDASGALVGWTEVAWIPKLPDTVWQWGTGVRPEHRGHALGKWLKAVMLRRILDERPHVKDIRTGNADSNDAMLGINHQLGFKPFQAETAWQMSLDDVRAYLAGASV